MKNKKLLIGTFSFFSVILFLTGMFLGYIVPKNSVENNLAQLNEIVYNNFNGEIDSEKINNAVLSAYVKALDDPYAQFISKEEIDEYNSSYKGQSTGIGFNYVMTDKGNMFICEVHKNSPADKCDIKKGDIITKIDDFKVSSKKSSEITKYFSNASEGDKFKFTIIRNKKTVIKTVTFSEFIKQTVFYEKIGEMGYIKFTHFETSTVNQFNDALKELMQKNVKGLIFDVRDNGGGLVSSVSKILDKLLPECDIISVKYKNGKEKVLAKSDKECIDLPMCVLINGNTASASELFAAALKEKRSAKLFGEKTFGKGVMQTTFNLTDGSCVKITVGKFYSPNKVNWDKKGIEPDEKITEKAENLTEEYYLHYENSDVFAAANKYLKTKIK